ncbi:sensor histidine kinase [Paenibacillus glucanolyticus]|jgi:two-component system sensor histidine kinase YesM|uniref:sensor histidine kinase n=1 Tax=Paenibacillus TaxID=44249 RepID=UPI0003E2197B|nr:MULTISPECIES: sensor histidine kinase [Paenibacillus]ANA79859.1 two-component sensor histidine kinase [Paenibacillus glucanolyticus]AVV56117.1 sensor histidine kinase [Paenibacillus glucanolyticus]ETT38239.1 integral membrane sensor signal transduction histidine kinase [Paenibacillus sp. FSL R5-808]MPY20174.1 sensor histidine kinase [Paenibacillus glucanolyticus]
MNTRWTTSSRINGKKLGYIPIGYKLMLTFTIFILLLVFVNFYISHSMYDDTMRKQSRVNIQGTLNQIRDNVAYKVDDIVQTSATLYDDPAFIQSVLRNLSGADNHIRMNNVILPKLESAAKAVGLNLRLSVYFHNQTVYERYRNWDNANNQDFNEQSWDMYHMTRISSEFWYFTLPEEKYNSTMTWRQVEEDERDGRISLIRRIVDMNNPLDIQEVGIMRFSVRLSQLFDSVDYTKLGDGSVLSVLDPFGNVVFTSGSMVEDPDHTSDKVNPHAVIAPNDKKNYLVIEEDLPQKNWKIVAQVPLNIIEQEAKRVRTVLIVICIICVVLFTYTGYVISRSFSKRIQKLVGVLNAFREGELHKRIAYRGKGEFPQIANALNAMGEDIEALINKVYLTQLQKKEAELEMLQSQINPHFLYNTLSSINQLAKFGETEKLQNMVVQLAQFYRLTLNSGRILIPIALEIEQANAYLDIQKVKYGQRMEVNFDVDTSIWPYETIKLILQPFIENVLKHAWSGDRIHIRIVVKKEGDTILYRIIDDGLGMKQGRIEEIFDPRDNNHTGCGIRNIDQRVKLHYGSEYGVSIFSKVGIGTSVQIRIPARARNANPDKRGG